MGPFNKGEVAYIKAVAGTGDHHTYKEVLSGFSGNNNATVFHSLPEQLTSDFKMYCLGDAPLSFNGTSNATPIQNIDVTPIKCYDIPINPAQTSANNQQRVTPECFLETVNMKMRIVQQIGLQEAAQDHNEYRMLIFRHKEKQHHEIQHASNFANPLYDVFLNESNFYHGPLGYRNKIDDHGDQNYVDVPNYKDNFNDADRLLTSLTNKEDYVFMKDVRFYLGTSYSGKHIYETRMKWDHQDPISTDLTDITTTASLKNYVWYVLLIRTNNIVGNRTTGAPPQPCVVKISTSTHVTSG